MSRYVRASRIKSDWIDDALPLIPQISVDDNEPVDTGLVWESGDSIMRLPNPIGFGRDDEW